MQQRFDRVAEVAGIAQIQLRAQTLIDSLPTANGSTGHCLASHSACFLWLVYSLSIDMSVDNCRSDIMNIPLSSDIKLVIVIMKGQFVDNYNAISVAGQNNISFILWWNVCRLLL